MNNNPIGPQSTSYPNPPPAYVRKSLEFLSVILSQRHHTQSDSIDCVLIIYFFEVLIIIIYAQSEYEQLMIHIDG